MSITCGIIDYSVSSFVIVVVDGGMGIGGVRGVAGYVIRIGMTIDAVGIIIFDFFCGR